MGIDHGQNCRLCAFGYITYSVGGHQCRAGRDLAYHSFTVDLLIRSVQLEWSGTGKMWFGRMILQTRWVSPCRRKHISSSMWVEFPTWSPDRSTSVGEIDQIEVVSDLSTTDCPVRWVVSRKMQLRPKADPIVGRYKYQCRKQIFQSLSSNDFLPVLLHLPVGMHHDISLATRRVCLNVMSIMNVHCSNASQQWDQIGNHVASTHAH